MGTGVGLLFHLLSLQAHGPLGAETAEGGAGELVAALLTALLLGGSGRVGWCCPRRGPPCLRRTQRHLKDVPCKVLGGRRAVTGPAGVGRSPVRHSLA